MTNFEGHVSKTHLTTPLWELSGYNIWGVEARIFPLMQYPDWFKTFLFCNFNFNKLPFRGKVYPCHTNHQALHILFTLLTVIMLSPSPPPVSLSLPSPDDLASFFLLAIETTWCVVKVSACLQVKKIPSFYVHFFPNAYYGIENPNSHPQVLLV